MNLIHNSGGHVLAGKYPLCTAYGYVGRQAVSTTAHRCGDEQGNDGGNGGERKCQDVVSAGQIEGNASNG